jgi:phosphoadenosine phosphosulfate reductase
MTATLTPITSETTVAQPVAVRRRARLSPAEVEHANRDLEGARPSDVVGWARRAFGTRLVVTASFADTTLIDIAVAVDPDIEVVFLDTGFHFAETLGTVRRAMDRYSLNLTVLRPDGDAPDVWGAGSTACCDARKVAPLDRYLSDHADAWMSGVRRADDPSRANARIVSIDTRGLVKIYPMAAMDDDAYERYVADHDVLINTLHLDGYASIGCWPCTEPSTDGRAGRWAGSAKTECGLHL